MEVGTGRFDKNYLKYTYRVSTVPQTEYKFITSAVPYPTSNNTARELVNRHGIRILVTTAGRVGYFDAMTFLINLNVAAGLLGVSYLLMDVIVVQCWWQRELFRQFKERQTVNMSQFRNAIEASSEAKQNYKTLLADHHIEDAHSSINKMMQRLIEKSLGREDDSIDLFTPATPAAMMGAASDGGSDSESKGFGEPLLRAR